MGKPTEVVVSLLDDDANQFFSSYNVVTPILQKGKQITDTIKDDHIPLKAINSIKERESMIIQDLLYVITGYEGVYIRYTSDVDQSDIYKCLKGFTYRINKDIDINFKDITKQLCFLGKHYSSLSHFACYFDNRNYGNVMGSLCEYIRKFLCDYEKVVHQLHISFDHDINFSLISLYQRFHDVSFELNYPSLFDCMQQLYTLVQHIIDEDHKRLKESNLLNMKFENIMKSLKSDIETNILDDIVIDSQNSKYVKGGVILNMIYTQMNGLKGNDRLYTYLRDILETSSVHYIRILNQWLQFGIIDDPFQEFCIIESTLEEIQPPAFNSYYWLNKFAIKMEGLLQQLSTKKQQKHLFLCGKYLSIIRECKCDKDISTASFTKIKSLQDVDLELVINEAYQRSNKLFVNMLEHQYELPKFIKSMNEFFLLSDGSLFNAFLNESNHELKRSFQHTSTSDILRNYTSIYQIETKDKISQLFNLILYPKFENHSILYDISEIIKTQITDAKDIMKTSNLGSLAELLKTNANLNLNSSGSNTERENKRCNKLAITRFNIDMDIPFPLNQIILDFQKLEYQILFRHLALVKFIEKRFEKSWRELGYQTFWTWNFDDMRVRSWIKRCRFIHTKMFDFLKIYMFYIQYDVVVPNWNVVETILEGIENGNDSSDISVLKRQITDFLSSSMSEFLLSQNEMVNCLYEIFTLIIVFHEYVMSMRKVLLVMDENLLNVHKKRLNLSLKYDPFEKEKKLDSIINVLDSYHHTFNQKLKDLCQYLAYFTELDSPKMVILHSNLVSTFNLK